MLEKGRTPKASDLIAAGHSETQAIHSAAVVYHLIPAGGREEQKRDGEGARISTLPVGSVARLGGCVIMKARDS